MNMNQFSFCLLNHQTRGRRFNIISYPTNNAGNAYVASDVFLISYYFPLVVFSLLSQDIHRFVALP